MNLFNLSAGLQSIREQIARVLHESHPDSIKVFLERLEYQSFPLWASPQLTLCLVDPIIQNSSQRPGSCASVDRENSDRGDPAYDIADLMDHPAFLMYLPHDWIGWWKNTRKSS